MCLCLASGHFPYLLPVCQPSSDVSIILSINLSVVPSHQMLSLDQVASFSPYCLLFLTTPLPLYWHCVTSSSSHYLISQTTSPSAFWQQTTSSSSHCFFFQTCLHHPLLAIGFQFLSPLPLLNNLSLCLLALYCQFLPLISITSPCWQKVSNSSLSRPLIQVPIFYQSFPSTTHQPSFAAPSTIPPAELIPL